MCGLQPLRPQSEALQDGFGVAPELVTSEISGGFITLALVVKTQGRRGEVAAEVHSDAPDRFAEGMKLFALGRSQDVRRELEVEDLWPHKSLLVLKFRGVDSISDAEPLVGAELQVPRVERAELEQGWYVSDLVGCTVFDHGREIGRIKGVQLGTGEAPLLLVTGDAADGAGKKFDLPFAEAYLEGVDIVGQQVRMRLPAGMLEINAPVTAEEELQQKSEGKKKRKRRAGER
jgi:16S rRNA processing protein RimM